MTQDKNYHEADKPLHLWREGDMILNFGLKRIINPLTPLMKEWMEAPYPNFNEAEQYLFDHAFQKAEASLVGWSEEDLKMKLISPVLDLGYLLEDSQGIVSLFDKLISSEVDNIPLSVRTDFMIATGVLDAFRKPFFHFQEYKPQKNPSGDSMAQLLMAFLIAQQINQDKQPLYGAEIIRKTWTFVVMEGREYCVSKAFVSTDRDDLLSIIGILRKFRELLFSRFLKD
ncbi:MAG: hypothetical protein HC880_07805 [Bacteroidia bacterium]|nr:hypothetical protein [Bacteroidia bacterium]